MMYLIAILLAGLIALGIIDYSQRRELTADKVAQAAGLAINQTKLKDASDVKANENQELDNFVLSKPVPAIRLCNAPVQAPAAPGASTSPSAGAVQPLPAGDTGAVSEQHADIGPMLILLAKRADQVANDLREQQSVP